MAKGRARLVIDRSQMGAVLTGPQSKPVVLVQRAQRQVLNQAKINAPVDTGQLRASHKAEPVVVSGDTVRTSISATGSAKQEYALMVHEGTGPHIIRPRRKKVLSWKGPQGRVFAQQVHHPGTKPRPWLRKALEQVAPRLGFTVETTS